MESFINPCPFCGEIPEMQSDLKSYNSHQFSKYFWFECSGCGIKTATFLTEIGCGNDGIISIIHDGAEELINFWNSRYTPPEPDDDEHPIEGDDSEENLNSLDSTNP